MGVSIPPETNWFNSFEPFGVTHAVVVIVTAALIVWSCRRGKRRFGTPAERTFRKKWVLSIVFVQILHMGYWLMPDHFDIGTSLPLHLCDLVVWVAAAALTWDKRWVRALLYFWAIGLSTQAFFTPVLRQGPATVHFWFFWITHVQIVGSAIYDVAARGYRPTGRDYLTITIANFAYLGLVTPFNLLLGVNYGYLGESRPNVTTIIDALGTWPMRLVWVALIVQGGMLGMWLVWPGVRMLRTKPAPDA